MRILLIAPLCPLPLEKGGAVRIWNIAKQLSLHHTVDLLCFIRSDSEQAQEAELKQVFRNVHFILRREIISPRVLLEKGLQKLSFFTQNFSLARDSLFSNRSILSQLYDHPDVLRYVQLADMEREYDLFYAETYYGISALHEHLCELKTPLLLCEQNVEYAAYRRQLEMQSTWLVRLLMQIDVWKMRREEIRYWKQVSLLAGLSRVDVSEIQDESSREDVMLVENGVDVEWFGEKRNDRISNEILFVGNFAYFPNVDAVRWLVDEIWPGVLSQVGEGVEYKLRIVGRGADQNLKNYLEEKGLEIDETVDDIRDAFQRATVLLAPLRAGSGTKYKILEAMASRCPVVTTTVGAEGLEVADQHEMIIADTAEQLAESVMRVVQNKQSQYQLAENGYQFVQANYDWKQIVGDFDRKLRDKITAYV